MISVMKRYEYKYILNKEQIKYLLNNLDGHMSLDNYGITSIQSLYYDTDNYELIRNSIEGNSYKEKIRLRSYGLLKNNKPVFLELKRKSEGIVYKRRIESDVKRIDSFFNNELSLNNNQIEKEISYFKNHYKCLNPKCLIIYDRASYYEVDGNLRLTIDYNSRYRIDNLRLDYSLDGNLLLDEGSAILEIKIQDSMPLWLSNILDKGHIYKSSMSKYGTCYKNVLHNLEVKTC